MRRERVRITEYIREKYSVDVTNDDERWQWVVNVEPLYLAAKYDGVNV